MWAGWKIHGWKADSEKLELCRTDLTKAAGELARAAQNAENNRRLANDYYDQLGAIDRQLAAAKRVQPQRCVCPISKPASTSARDARAGTDGELHSPDGVTVESLYDFAGDAERVRQQLLACQAWVKKQE